MTDPGRKTEFGDLRRVELRNDGPKYGQGIEKSQGVVGID